MGRKSWTQSFHLTNRPMKANTPLMLMKNKKTKGSNA